MTDLPQINEADRSFALKVINEYSKLDYDDICQLIRDVRRNISFDWNEDETEYSKAFKLLYDPDIKIEKVTLITNKGEINIDSDDRLFKNFVVPIEKLKSKYADEINYIIPKLNQGLKDASFEKVFRYIYSTYSNTVGPFQRNVIIGMFAVHFGLFAREALMARIEWDNNPKGDSYKHYLAGNIETRIQPFLK